MSNRQEPQIQSGPRGPLGSPAAPSQEAGASAVSAASVFAPRKKKPAAPPDPNVIRFRSRYSGYRIQITAPADVFEPASGRVIKGRPKVAQFRGGYFETKDPETLKVMLDSGKFGLGNDFWRVEDQEKHEANVAMQEAAMKVAAVKGLPVEQQAVVDALLDQLRSAVAGPNFELPPTSVGA